jgi:hypothetical protein
MRFLRIMLAVLALGGFLWTLAGPVAATMPKLYQLADERVRNWSPLECDLSRPGSGLVGLHLEVEAALELLGAEPTHTFRLSPGLRQDEGLKQRMEEVMWPIAYDEDATVLLRRETESSSCAPVLASKGVALDRCQ